MGVFRINSGNIESKKRLYRETCEILIKESVFHNERADSIFLLTKPFLKRHNVLL